MLIKNHIECDVIWYDVPQCHSMPCHAMSCHAMSLTSDSLKNFAIFLSVEWKLSQHHTWAGVLGSAPGNHWMWTHTRQAITTPVRYLSPQIMPCEIYAKDLNTIPFGHLISRCNVSIKCEKMIMKNTYAYQVGLKLSTAWFLLYICQRANYNRFKFTN